MQDLRCGPSDIFNSKSSANAKPGGAPTRRGSSAGGSVNSCPSAEGNPPTSLNLLYNAFLLLFL